MHSRSEFAKLWAASFVSQSGSHFLTIALAGYVFATSGSIVKSALVFVLSYLPSVFFSAQLGNWIDLKLSRWLLARNELISIVASGLCGVCIAFQAPLVCLCVVIGLRSLLLFIARTGGSKWIKIISPPEFQAHRIRLFFLSFFLSTAVAGILAATVLVHGSIPLVVAVDIATYVLSFLMILLLRELPSHDTAISTPASINIISTVSEILRTQELRSNFLAVCLSQAVFQGAYTVLVSYLPIHTFKMGVGGIGPFQLAASVGITLGFGIVSLWPQIFQSHEGRWPFRMVLILGIASVIQCVTADLIPTSLLMFFSMNFAFECIWLFNQSEFFRKSPAKSIGRFQFTLTSSASFLMASFTLFYSALIQWYGVQIGVLSTLAAGLLLWRLAQTKVSQNPESLSLGVQR